tara:strand:- start:326 stop:601 length:276 start_codon:yes stop_codon:yes gene_type:complete
MSVNLIKPNFNVSFSAGPVSACALVSNENAVAIANVVFASGRNKREILSVVVVMFFISYSWHQLKNYLQKNKVKIRVVAVLKKQNVKIKCV